MGALILLARIFPFLVIILLCGCTPRKGPWIYREIVASAVEDTSALLHFQPPQKYRGIEFHSLAGSFGRVGYLGITSGCLPSPAQVTLVSLEESFSFCLEPHLGFQSVRLPPEALEYIFFRLMENKAVTISCGSYHSTLTPTYFPSIYSKFCAIEQKTALY
jgi:hypothetical protein